MWSLSKSAPVGADLDLTYLSGAQLERINRHQLVPIPSVIIWDSVIKIGTNWCLFILTVMRDTVVSKSAPIGADLDLTISLRSTVRMNKEAPIGADSFCDNERYCQIKIGTNWCLFSLTVMRDSVISKLAPIGASLFILWWEIHVLSY